MTDEVAERSRAILLETREELERADNKASILLAATGVVLGALVAATLAGDWSPPASPEGVRWLYWAGIWLVCAAIFLLGSAVYPRIQAKGWRPNAISYYGDVVAAGAKNKVEELLRAPSDNPNKRVIDQLMQVSTIVQKKYVAIRRAMFCLGLGAAAWIISGIVAVSSGACCC
ncbi:Pycsar system effector family protein [Arthrobacter sp.]|uniref:Pycsar system effector family protein n=1 Tax=Arthrobacter sp. TaxID=1667 RepID=UPI003A94CEBE